MKVHIFFNKVTRFVIMLKFLLIAIIYCIFSPFLFGITDFACPHPDRVVYTNGEKEDIIRVDTDLQYHRINHLDQFRNQIRLNESISDKKYNRDSVIRVIDSFTFFNEFETLYIRLNELHEQVDTFVIVEAEETFTGKKRSLNFPKISNSTIIEKFISKILYRVCSFPNNLKVRNSNDRGTIWQRERYMRSHCLANALRDANIKDEDLFIFSDIDEIPSAASIAYLSNCKVFKGNIPFEPSLPTIMIAFLSNRLHFNFHCRSPNMGNWPHPVVQYGVILKHKRVEDLRGRKGNPLFWTLGGWHFSNFHYGDINMLIDKFDAFSHQELKEHYVNDAKYWKDVMHRGGSEKINTHCEEYHVIDIPEYIFKMHDKYQILLNEKQLEYAVKKYPS